MNLFVEIVYVFITVVMILVVLLQAGRGGGLGTALGGGASQGVFGGGGGADFLAKLTQGLAAGFMICAVYLAYASAHTGSSRLQAESDESQVQLVDENQAVDYERVGEGTPLPLPEPGGASVIPQPTAVFEPANEAEALGAALEALEEARVLPAEIEAAAVGEAHEANEAAAPTDVEAPTAEPLPTEPDALVP
jgi:preprotein translocase subunit SecG